jgi:hypothetical protein
VIARLASLILLLFCGLGNTACDEDCDCPDDPGEIDGGVTCDDEPSACEDLGDVEAQHFGCCLGSTVYWCDGDVLESIDCALGGYSCGYSESDEFMDCI